MSVSLSSHFTYKNLFKQSLPPILMLVFTSVYGMVDGFFISNFDSESAFAGVNLIYPIIALVGGLGFMFGSGGSALVSKLLGEKENEKANQVFTNVLITSLIVGIIFSVVGYILIEPLANALGEINGGSSPLMVEKAIDYGHVLMCGQCLFMTQNLYQNFFVVDEKQNLGFYFTLAAGCTNIVLDALFVAIFKWGIVGAAIATILGFVVGSIGPTIYFLTHKNDLIHLVIFKYEIKPILKCCTNGLSDFIFNVSTSIVSIIYNIQLLKFYGQNGVSAYGAVMYISFLFLSIFIGYSIGIAPVIGYNYGAKNHNELSNVLKKSHFILGIISFMMTLISFVFSRPLALLFLSGNEELVHLCTKAMKLYSLSFLFAGISIFITSFFTALNNGLISGLISIFRTFISQVGCVLLLPLMFEGTGIFISPFVAELLAIIVAVIFLETNKKRYHY